MIGHCHCKAPGRSMLALTPLLVQQFSSLLRRARQGEHPDRAQTRITVSLRIGTMPNGDVGTAARPRFQLQENWTRSCMTACQARTRHLLRVLFVTAEMDDFVRVGGLAAVS